MKSDVKKFVRSIPGKTLLFIMTVALATVCLGAAVCGIIFMEEDLYTDSEQEMIRERLVSHSMATAHDYVETWVATFDEAEAWMAEDRDDESEDRVSEDSGFETGQRFPEDYGYENVEIQMQDETGKLVSHTSGDALSANSSEIIYFDYTVWVTFRGDRPVRVAYDFEGARDNRSGVSDGLEEKPYTISVGLIPRSVYTAPELWVIHQAFTFRYLVYPIALGTLILGLICLVALMCAAGHRPEDDELVPGPLWKVPYDLMVFAGICVIAIPFGVASEAGRALIQIIGMVVSFVIFFAVGLALLMSLASRIKQHALIRNTVIFIALAMIRKCVLFLYNKATPFLPGAGRAARVTARKTRDLFHDIPMVWRTVLVIAVLSFAEFIAIYVFWRNGEGDLLIICWFLEKCVLIPVILFGVISLRKLQKAGEALASGDMNYHMDTEGLYWDFKKHGDNLNSISIGMAQAVEERMRSERMKTELITNVSHDIKTPLTSIINYASLIEKEHTENEKIHEYTEVLTRQSVKLKRLIEDLVEASKASTGNLEVNPVPCEASVFVNQVGGEFEDKLASANLTLITQVPERDVWIQADPRRMWRVFDNLMNNICKYSQPGTRVYLSLEDTPEGAVFTFKNTSRDALNIDPSELMERFVRGDSSRHTEGNGLGLSIARSMVELQDGTFRLEIDGDLFKVRLAFPKL